LNSIVRDHPHSYFADLRIVRIEVAVFANQQPKEDFIEDSIVESYSMKLDQED